jgi:hypothetical protein
VGLRRVLGHDQPGRDLTIRESLGDEVQDLELARCQATQIRPPVERIRHGRESLDEATCDRRCEDRAAVGRHPDRRQQLVLGCILEQEPARPASERLEHVLIKVERGQDDDPRRGPRSVQDLSSRSQPIELRHPDVHQDDVGSDTPDHIDGLATIHGLGDDRDVRLAHEDHPEAGSDEPLVIGQDDADRGAHAGCMGSVARTMKPPPGRGPISRCPSWSETRSRIPASPWPSSADRTDPAPVSPISSSKRSMR